MRKRPRDTNDLKSLIELKHGDERINVIAVAYSSSPPTNTKGAHHYVRFELVDETTTNIVSCLLFAPLEMLPDVSTFSHPAVVRLRRFKVVGFQDRVQLVDGYGHSWSMFSRDNDSFVPEDKSHENTAKSLTLAEVNRIAELRNWLRSDAFNNTIFQRAPVQIPSQFAPDRTGSVVQSSEKFNKFANGLLTLKDIEKDLYFNLVAQVIGIRRDSDCSILRCIDGTKPTINTFKTNSLYIETTLTQLVMAQLFDLYIDIAVYDEHNLVVDGVELGNFVEFNNLHCYIPSSSEMCEVVLHRGSMYNRGMRILYPDHDSIPPVQQRIDQLRVCDSSSWNLPAPPPYDETSPPTTKLSHPDLPLSSVVDILQKHQQSTTPSHLYRVRVFVDSYTPDNYPSFMREFCGPCNSFSILKLCRKCGRECLNKEIFFKLQVRDHEDGVECEVKCFAAAARELLGVGQEGGLSMGQLEEVERLVGRWCDLSVFCVRGAVVLKGCSLAW